MPERWCLVAAAGANDTVTVDLRSGNVTVKGKSISTSSEDQLNVALRQITRPIDLHSRELMRQFGLTAPQLASLQAIERLQPVTVGALAKSIHLSQATVPGILTRLERGGLVSRGRNGSDRRTVIVELKENGRAVLESAPSLLQNCFRRELLRLHEWERTQMLATLQRVVSNDGCGRHNLRSASRCCRQFVRIYPSPGQTPSTGVRAQQLNWFKCNSEQRYERPNADARTSHGRRLKNPT